MSFDVLAEEEDEDDDTQTCNDNKENCKTHKQKLVTALSAPATSVKPVLTAQQKKILEQQKVERDKKKQEREKKKDLESRCFFYDECKSKRQNPWPYCKNCYSTRTGECLSCKAPTTLTATPGLTHTHCKTCRKTNNTNK